MKPVYQLCLLLLLGHMQSYAQGTLQITFDGPPAQPPGTARIVQDYFESGMWFRPVGVLGFVIRGGGVPGFPEDGTPYLQAGLGSTLAFSLTNGLIFDLAAVDMAEYSDVAGPGSVHIVGYRHDGTTVTTDVETGGINFHTVYFSPSFTGLDRVEIPNYGWSLDNQRYNARAPATASGFTKPVTPSSEPERL